MPDQKLNDSQNERIYFTRPQAAVLIAIIIAALLLLVNVGCTKQADLSADNPNQPPISSKPQKETELVKLYFADEQASYLKPEVREIPLDGKTLPEAAVEELIKGPQDEEFSPTIPAETKLISLQVTDDVAYVNFSKELQTKHWGGTTGETMTVYSIVNTLADLGEGIKKVQILIEGEKTETLAGHMEITEPIAPDWLMVSTGDIRVGPVELDLDKMREIQEDVDQGHQPWYLDPLQTAQQTGTKFGFDPRRDNFVLADAENAKAEYSSTAKVVAVHDGEEYIIQLVQPIKTGPEGIWVINSVTLNK